ncbi:hypothetical protein TYRP_015876 [Tyrophagus putrescentiae]|nr:hypothetical protein TYRP_015876 [Tyrophagus putrescentiae]
MREICESFPTFFSGNELSFYTSISHIRLRNVRIFGHKTVLRTGVDVIGRGVVGRDEENVGLRSIGEVLRAFLGRRPNVAAIVICQSYSQAIMKRTSANDTTTKYYLIDPHQFDSATAFRLPLQGPLPPNDNNAAFVAFDSAESLIWVFTNLVSQIAEDFDAHEWARIDCGSRRRPSSCSWRQLDGAILNFGSDDSIGNGASGKADKKQCATGQNKWTKLSCLYVLLLLLVRQYQSISRK